MIVKMRKYSFLVYHQLYTDFLDKIREIGVLHIIEKAEGVSEDVELNQQLQKKAKMKNLLRQLKSELPKKYNPRIDNSVDGHQLVDEIEALYTELEAQQQQVQLLDREWERMEIWGDFSHERLEDLEKAGFDVKFFSCQTRRFDPEWEINYNAFEIDTVGANLYFMTINPIDVELDIDADPIRLSDKNAIQIAEEIKQVKGKIDDLRSAIRQFAILHYGNLEEYEKEISGEIDFTKVILNTRSEVDNKVMLLEGWCPEENIDELDEYLDSMGVYYQTSEPEEQENVPIKLKNNKFIRLYELIGEMYDLPNYHEIDLTPFFAPFFLLFFGLCVGDTAYGLLILIAALVLRYKAKPNMKPVFSLAAWLGASTVVLGFFSGTFFGFELVNVQLPWFERFKVVMLDSDQLFYLSLIIGAVQILFGMIIKTVGKIIRFGWPAAFSSMGWLIIILGMGSTYVLSNYTEIEPRIINYMYYGFGILGGLLVFILNDLKRNPFINVGAGLWDAYNMATGLLGDLLSYIRLFALGISSSVMGFVFNDLAINLSGNIPVLSTIVMLAIMLAGHGINIFMAVLGSFVHPMRLTFVEFYNNAGFEGGGKKYKPFKRV